MTILYMLCKPGTLQLCFNIQENLAVVHQTAPAIATPIDDSAVRSASVFVLHMSHDSDDCELTTTNISLQMCQP